MATTSATTTLSSTYTSLIKYQIEQEKKPLTRLEAKVDDLEIQSAVYTDLKSKLEALKSSSTSLLSTDPFYSLKEGRAVSVASSDTEKTVASASVTSSAVPGSYVIDDIVLAKNDKVRSNEQEYSDQALSYFGTFVIGGAATRSAVKLSETANTVTNFGTSEIEEGQLELGSGKYYIETRQNSEGTWQFRMVDTEGNALKIKSSATSYSTNWQTIPTDGEVYDTGRGLTINFGTDAEQFAAATKLTGAASVEYEAKGNEITVTSEMSLVDIADAINSGVYGDGNGVSASVINKRLVISTDETGVAHQLEMSQTQGTILQQLGIFSDETTFNEDNFIQKASDASFSVDGMTVTRSQNTGLTDVIAGVTLNFSADAEGQSATINVAADNSGAKSTINNFITNFNGLLSYLSAKTTNTRSDDGTYKRASLSGDMTIVNLRYSLVSMFSKNDATGGLYKSMAAIGIEVTDSKTISITDESKLTAALKNNYSEVVDLMDRVMTEMKNTLAKFTGNSAYVDKMISANESQTESINDQIETWNDRIAKREAYLTQQYTEIQAQMTLLSYQSSTNSSWINSISSYYS